MRSREIWRLRLVRETEWFAVLNLFDVVTTYLLLRRNSGYFESNPIARWFYHGWGFEGMVWFKVAMVLFVVTVAQLAAHKDERLARSLLVFGSVAVGGVFVYSFWLGTHHAGI